MKKVTFAKVDGSVKEVRIRFSIGYFLLGPIYYFLKVMIVRGLLLTLIYALAIGLKWLDQLLVLVKAPEVMVNYTQIAAEWYWWVIGALVVFHLIMCTIAPRAVAKKLFKKGFVPYAEIDTQILIKVGLAKVGTLCYLSEFKEKDGVQGKIAMGNSKDLDKELEELKQLLKEGMITKDEYETKRAMAIMRKDAKKK